MHAYSLMLNSRRASCIWHNLDFPWSSCIAIMFLSKKLGLSCISPWFSTFPACFIAWWCHCYNYVRMPCLLIHPGLWVMSSALLVLHQGFQKKNIMSSNTTRLLLSTWEYLLIHIHYTTTVANLFSAADDLLRSFGLFSIVIKGLLKVP